MLSVKNLSFTTVTFKVCWHQHTHMQCWDKTSSIETIKELTDSNQGMWQKSLYEISLMDTTEKWAL